MDFPLGKSTIISSLQIQGNWYYHPMTISEYVHSLPIGSMYGIYGNIYYQYIPNVSIYTIHGSYGLWHIIPCDWVDHITSPLRCRKTTAIDFSARAARAATLGSVPHAHRWRAVASPLRWRNRGHKRMRRDTCSHEGMAYLDPPSTNQNG